MIIQVFFADITKFSTAESTSNCPLKVKGNFILK